MINLCRLIESLTRTGADMDPKQLFVQMEIKDFALSSVTVT